MTRARRTTVSICAAVAAVAGLTACGDDKDPAPKAIAAEPPAIIEGRLPARFFAADSAWNTRVDAMTIDPDSAVLLHRAAQRVGVVEPPGGAAPRLERRTVDAGMFVNTQAWTPTIVSGGLATPVRCRQQHCGTDITSLRIPADVDPDPRYDGWFTVVSTDGRTAYDLWRARRERDSSISYQFMRTWDLAGPGAGEPDEAAARGSGLPLFAGVIRRNELATGNIEHALAISVPGPARSRYVRPASATNGNGELDSLPEGARVRLKAGVSLRDSVDARHLSLAQQRARDAVLVALRRYGAIVVDRAAVPTLYVERGVDTDVLTGDELSDLGLGDLEVLKLGDALRDPPATGATG